MLVKRYGTGRMKVAASSFYKQQKLRQLSLSGHQVSRQQHQFTSCPRGAFVRDTRLPHRVDGRMVDLRYLAAEAFDTDGDDDDDEFAGIDPYRGHRRVLDAENDETRDRSKLILVLLVVPSLLALYSSHNKMNKGSESNIDMDALKSGSFPGFSHGPGGNSLHSMMNARRHLPDFEDDDIAHMVASEEKPSAQKYAERLMAKYRKYTLQMRQQSVDGSSS